MKTKLCRLFALLLFCSSFSVLGQGKIVNGTVSDESGMPLPGVNIIIDGTSTGTNTDFDGNYSISTKVGDVLTFTFLGFKSQSLTVGSSETINVTLFEDAATLDEVVVTDSIPLSKELKALDKVRQLTLAGMLSEAIRRVCNEESISAMFDS